MITSWHAAVAEQFAQRVSSRGWRVTPVVLDGVALLRVESRDVGDSQCLLDPARRAHLIMRAGWVWCGDVACPSEPLSLAWCLAALAWRTRAPSCRVRGLSPFRPPAAYARRCGTR